MREANIIFEGVKRLSEISSRMHMLQIQQEKLDNFERRECGNCFYWMKSRMCPRERNVKGMTRGPSCSGLPCKKFAREEHLERLIKEQKYKVSEAKKEVFALRGQKVI